MPSSYLSLHYHLVFSTKNREPSIEPAWRPELFSYLTGVIRGLEAIPQGCGGVADHVHLLVGLKATHRLSDFMREFKKSSSSWVHEKQTRPHFAWQEGYAAFSVSVSVTDRVQGYIRNQEQHHRKTTFREELVEMLNKAGIEFDPRYLD